MQIDLDKYPAVLSELLARVRGDEEVLGAILTGSQARPGMRTQDSDTDVFLVVTERGRERWKGWHSPELDVAVFRVKDLETPALPQDDIDSWWNRYAFAHALVLFDRTSGIVERLVSRQGTYDHDQALELTAEYLDGYLNFAIRSLKSVRDDRGLEARLDAAESIAYALVVIFALEQRVRPYNKYLLWELRNYPLRDEAINRGLPGFAERILLSGDGRAQRELFALVNQAITTPTLREVVESWGDDLALFETT